MAFARNIDGNFFVVRETNSSDTSKRGVRLLRLHRTNEQTDSAFLGAAFEDRGLRAAALLFATFTDQLINCRHSTLYNMILTNPLVLNDRNMDSEALVPVFKRQKAAFHTRLPLRTAPKSVTTLRAQRHKSIIRMIVMRRRYWSREKKEKFISLLGKPRRRSAVYRTRRSLGGAPKENRQFSLEFLDDLGDPDNFILLSVGADRRDKAAVDRSQTFVDVANTAFGFFQIVFVVELVDACGEADFTVSSFPILLTSVNSVCSMVRTERQGSRGRLKK